MPRFAGVEGGGTSFVACIGEEVNGELRLIERAEFPTLTPPSETISKVVEWLSARQYDALGVAVFGPVDLNPVSPTWGYITTTPKPGWQFVDIMGPLLKVRRVPYGFDTDVNAPALEEYRHFAGPGETSCAYITVGTGVGVGLVVNGQSVRGLIHPEGGHIPALKRRKDDTYAGMSSFHPWSVETQTAALALAERAGVPQEQLKNLPDDHPVWQDAADILGGLCATLTALLSVERIVLSGGVMQRLSLFPKIRKASREILDGYIQHPKILKDGPGGIDEYIVPSVRGNDAGIFGALALAVDAHKGGNGSKGAITPSTATPSSAYTNGKSNGKSNGHAPSGAEGRYGVVELVGAVVLGGVATFAFLSLSGRRRT